MELNMLKLLQAVSKDDKLNTYHFCCSMLVHVEMDEQCLEKFVFSVHFQGTSGTTDITSHPRRPESPNS
jgi:hypothetical protein